MRVTKSKGITLVALVVTIAVLLILAGISISQLTGSGLFEKVQYGKEEYTKQVATEKMNLKITNIQIKSYLERQKTPSLQEFAIELEKDEEDIEYETDIN